MTLGACLNDFNSCLLFCNSFLFVCNSSVDSCLEQFDFIFIMLLKLVDHQLHGQGCCIAGISGKISIALLSDSLPSEAHLQLQLKAPGEHR